MKKPQWILVGITVMFLCVMVGIFAGRRTAHAYIPLNDAVTAVGEGKTDTSVAGKIDLNTATFQQLQLLPGVGESLAQRILDYRDQIGMFDNIRQITNVNGIGEKKFEDMKDYITVEEYDEDSGS